MNSIRSARKPRRPQTVRMCGIYVARDTDLELGLKGREALSVGPQRGVQVGQAVPRQGHVHRMLLQQI